MLQLVCPILLSESMVMMMIINMYFILVAFFLNCQNHTNNFSVSHPIVFSQYKIFLGFGFKFIKTPKELNLNNPA